MDGDNGHKPMAAPCHCIPSQVALCVALTEVHLSVDDGVTIDNTFSHLAQGSLHP